ncbi:uncharacterized protein LOC116249308 isoform X2 [Nymphaea colorata]|uniref:uncharacterized protein LOC116249308 isoform X2 n=1 Tax=Nymphaea colorata TaxID=210225 RepID=UPI00129E14BB|nr:uncharacterized protein LOC116249308 isoform X2 [Nymphaea colorata]
MAVSTSCQCASSNSFDYEEKKRKRRRRLVLACAIAVCAYYETYMVKRRRRMPSLEGAKYAHRILGQGHEEHYQDVCRMNLRIFRKLCDIVRKKNLLHDTFGVKLEEQLLMFLYTIGNNVSNRNVQEHFQHSGETVSRHFNNVLNAIFELSYTYIRLPCDEDLSCIPEQYKFSPFKDCIGMVDGFHIPVTVAVECQGPFRNRKGSLSQNVMAACSFDSRFMYVLAGWEGSATDADVLQAALQDGFHVPAGKYYLVDAEYKNTTSFLAPYPGVKYHPKDFEGENEEPQTPEELFNLKHFRIGGRIDRTIGVLKKRFPVLKVGTSYPYESQAKLVVAACTLHNFILIENGGEDLLFTEYDNEVSSQALHQEAIAATSPNSYPLEQWQEGNVLRDWIADALWEEYLTQ